MCVSGVGWGGGGVHQQGKLKKERKERLAEAEGIILYVYIPTFMQYAQNF